GRRVLAVDDAPMASVKDRMVHIGAAAALSHHLDRLVGEADWRIGQREGQHALLRTRRPGDHAWIVVDIEVGDAEARHCLDDAHHTMLEAGIAEAFEVIDAAGAGLPMGHERPHRLVLSERLIADPRRYGLPLWALGAGHAF